MERYLQAALEPIALQLHRAALQVFQYSRRTIPVTEAASADLDRRPLPRCIAPYRTARRWLAPCRRHSRLAASATGNAGASEYVATPDRSRGTRFFDAHHLLQGAAVRRTDPGPR